MAIRVLLILILLLPCFISGCVVKTEQSPVSGLRTGDYLGMEPPDSIPEIFAPNIISTEYEIRDMTISPDGNEIFYSMQWRIRSVILRIVREDSVWGKPGVAPFSGEWDDTEPMFSPDGKKLFFSSARPTVERGNTGDYDIWFIEKSDSGYGDPVNVGAPINTEKNEFYPSITKDGSIYFTTLYERTEDIWVSRFENGEYQPPVRLSDSINTSSHYEFNAFVTPDEDRIFFTSFGRDDDMGGGDIYVSEKINGIWSKAKNPGTPVNSDEMDFCPYVSPDGSYLFFTSRRVPQENIKQHYTTSDLLSSLKQPQNGSLNIYWIDAKSLTK